MSVAIAVLVVYILLKWLGYAWWCRRGLEHVEKERRWRLALVWGAGRVILGLGFGCLIVLGSMVLSRAWREIDQGLRTILIYLVTYAPAHWLAWGIIGTLMRPAPRPVSAFLLGSPGWRLGGMLMSGLLDALFIYASGDIGNFRFG